MINTALPEGNAFYLSSWGQSACGNGNKLI